MCDNFRAAQVTDLRLFQSTDKEQIETTPYSELGTFNYKLLRNTVTEVSEVSSYFPDHNKMERTRNSLQSSNFMHGQLSISLLLSMMC